MQGVAHECVKGIRSTYPSAHSHDVLSSTLSLLRASISSASLDFHVFLLFIFLSHFITTRSPRRTIHLHLTCEKRGGAYTFTSAMDPDRLKLCLGQSIGNFKLHLCFQSAFPTANKRIRMLHMRHPRHGRFEAPHGTPDQPPAVSISNRTPWICTANGLSRENTHANPQLGGATLPGVLQGSSNLQSSHPLMFPRLVIVPLAH